MNTNIVVAEFWNAYFTAKISRLSRLMGEGYKGTIIIEEPANLPSMFRNKKEQPFSIAMGKILNYDYVNDKRFQYVRSSLSVETTIIQIIKSRFDYINPPPYGVARMSEIVSSIDRKYQLTTKSPLNISDLIVVLNTYLEAPGELQRMFSQEMTVIVWLLGEFRAIESSQVLLRILSNSSYIVGSSSNLHYSIIDNAYSTLWKINSKSCLKELLELFKKTSGSGRLKIAHLFGRWLSTSEFLGPAHLGERYDSPQYWSDFLKPFINYSELDWARFDTKNLFWELRYMAVNRLGSKDGGLLRVLAEDEISVVRDHAKKRITSLSK